MGGQQFSPTIQRQLKNILMHFLHIDDLLTKMDIFKFYFMLGFPPVYKHIDIPSFTWLIY